MLQGQFVWHELMTTDAPAAEAFYGHVAGWAMQDAGMTDFRYTLLTVEGVPVCGLMGLPKEACDAGAKPGWVGSIVVHDVDAMAVKVQQAGGTVVRPPADIPNVGRFCVVTDPQGAKFVLLHLTGTPPVKPVTAPTPGTVGWNELHAQNWQEAFAFYETVFGWTKDTAVDMGPMGVYQLFAVGGKAIGGMMTVPEGTPTKGWLYYVCVDKVDAAVARVTEKGGKVLMGPHEVPGGSWIVQCQDPQGVFFALVGPVR